MKKHLGICCRSHTSELRFKKTKCFFLENRRDNLEQIKEEIAEIKEKLDILMNRLPLEEKKLKIEGKIMIYFFQRERGRQLNSSVADLVRFRVVYKCNFLLRR